MLAKQFFLLGFFTLITCAAFAQPVGVGVKLSPVPIWPKSGVIPIELQDRYVFLDPEAGELVLAYPEDVGNAEFEAGSGALRVRRIDLGNQVAASISIDVERKGTEFEYRYRVANHKQARHPIQQLQVAVPITGEPDNRVAAPLNWFGSVTAGPRPVDLEFRHPLSGESYSAQLDSSPDRAKSATQPTADLFQMPTNSLGAPAPLIANVPGTGILQPSSALIHWHVDGGLKVEQIQMSMIVPGSERDGFVVNSPLRPGVTTAYSYGRAPILLDSDIPPVVRAQAAPMLRYGAQRTFTVGPVFPPQALKIEVVAAYHLALQRLVRHGRLDANSAAVREALMAMEGYFEHIQVAYAGEEDLSLSEIAGPPLILGETPKSGFEAEVLHALKLSLSE